MENQAKRIARQKALNVELNPRFTQMGEATQFINPLTGRVYEDQFYFIPHEKIIKKYFPDTTWDIDDSKFIYTEDDPEFIRYQSSLARMDVREGKMFECDYNAFLRTLGLLEKAYKTSPDLILGSITDANGLDKALRHIEMVQALDESEKEKQLEIYALCNIIIPTELDKYSFPTKTTEAPKNFLREMESQEKLLKGILWEN